MHYPVNTLEDKKLLLKLRARRLVRAVIESAITWLLIGIFIGLSITSYAVIGALNEVDKIMVCK